MLVCDLVFAIPIDVGKFLDLAFQILDFLDMLHFFELKRFLLPADLHLIPLDKRIHSHFILSL